MTAYVALLRAVNLGGNSTLKMAALKRICEEAGLEKVKTYIASGNVLFESGFGSEKVKKTIEAGLEKHAGKRIDVFVRTAKEMAAVLRLNPFADAPGNRVVAVILDDKPAVDAAATASGGADEKVAAGTREIYIHIPRASAARSSRCRRPRRAVRGT